MYYEDGNRGGFEPRRMGARFAPVKVGEEIDVRIESVGEKGDGIARKKGFILFVPNTQEGEEVRIRVTKVLRKVGFAEALGPAQGSVEENDSQPPRQEEAPQEEPTQSYVEEQPEPVQDSESFGEESEKQE